MKLHIAGKTNDSIVDGEGYRFTIFTQGCPHHCEGCHNPQTWGHEGGEFVETSELIEEISTNPLLQGVTFSGGEPFLQPEPLSEIADWAHENNLDVWSFSGWTFEELCSNPARKSLLEKVDVLVDGKFILAERDLTLLFRGSRNQRLVDVQKSLEKGEVVLWQPN